LRGSPAAVTSAAGIHVAADDFTGRTRGALIGAAVFDLAQRYFDGTAP
jgi:hypothetical protein